METPNLPHFAIEDNPDKTSKKKVFMIAVFSFLLLSLPVGLYLVQQQQQISSKASNDPAVKIEKSISLITPSETVGVNQEIPVDVVIRSDNKYVNLASIKLQFNPSLVKVSELITNTSQTQNQVFFGKYWLSKGYDNDKGEVHLIAGSAKPGVQTTPGGQTLLLAQVRFVALSEGTSEISIAPEASLLTNADNTRVEFIKNNLTLTIHPDAALPGSGTSAFAGKLLPRFAEMQPSSDSKDQIIITSPKAADVFFYFRPVTFAWNAAVEQIKSIVLYLNGEPYGIVAENIPNTNQFAWTPSLSVPLPMVVPENTYSYQVIGQDKNGQEIKSAPSVPFGIIADPNGKTVSSASSSLNKGDKLTIDDASKILSSWGEKLQTDNDLDLNNDWVINFLDWYLLRRALFVKDLVY